MNKSILCSVSLAIFTLSANSNNDEYKRQHTWVDTGINLSFCTYPCLALSMLKQKYPHLALAKIPNRMAQAICAGIFCAKEWYGRKK